MTPLMPLGPLSPLERNPVPPEPRDEGANLREILAGDEAATQRFHDRMLDLDRRFERWCDVDPVPMGEPA